MFCLYTEIFHFNQLSRLDPEFAAGLEGSLNQIVARQGGQPVKDEKFLYRFPSLFEETTAKIVEGIFRIQDWLVSMADKMSGFSLIVMAVEDSDMDFEKRLQYLRYQTLLDNCIWIDKKTSLLLSAYADFDAADEDSPLLRVSGQKRHLPFLVDRLSRIKDRPLVKEGFTRLLAESENDPVKKGILLIKSTTGVEAEYNIKGVFSEKGRTGRLLVMSPARHFLDVFGPFFSLLNSALLDSREYDPSDADRENEKQFLLKCMSGHSEELCRDRFREDFLTALGSCLKQNYFVDKKSSEPLFIMVRSAETWLDQTWLLMGELLMTLNPYPVVMIIVTADHDFQSGPEWGECHTMTIHPMDREEINSNLKDLIHDLNLPEDMITEEMVHYSRGFPLLLFHYLFFVHNLGKSNDEVSLINTLDQISRLLFLLVYRTSGLLQRSLFIDYLKSSYPSDPAIEERFNRLIQLGLMEELENGNVMTSYPAIMDDLPIAGLADEKAELEKFALYLYQKWSKGAGIMSLDLFLFMEENGPVLCGLEILSLIIRFKLNAADHKGLRTLMDRPFYSGRKLPAAEYSALQNLLKTARLRDVLVEGLNVEISRLVSTQSDLLVASAGLYSDYFRLQQGHYYYTQEDSEKSLSYIKDALFSFQKNGDHYGEAVSNIDLGLCLLHSGKVRPALEYFEIARRISYQIGDAYSLIRSSSFEAVAHFVYGNIPRAMRVLEGVLPLTLKESRRDWYLLQRFLEGRISFELGDYEKAGDIFSKGSEYAESSDYLDISERFRTWHGRSLAYGGKSSQADKVLLALKESRESLYFLAESAFLSGNNKKAVEYSQMSDDLILPGVNKDPNKEVMGERNLWCDGFSLLEGRLGSLHSQGDTLYCLNNSLRFYAFGMMDDFVSSEEGFDRLFRNDHNRMYRPYNYLHYFLNAMIVLRKPEKSMEAHLRLLSKAVSELQSYAGRFDDQQVKRSFMTRNFWCRKIIDEAKKQKFM
jgi:tetratricopeptide (TPR) repeat protein